MKTIEQTTEEKIEALEAVISFAQAEIKRLSDEKKVVGRDEIIRMNEVFVPLWSNIADKLVPTPIARGICLADIGQSFTTQENCEAFIAYQKAVANLMYACKPFLTEDTGHAYSPCLNDAGEAATSSMANPVPMFLWVDSYTKALEIAEAHKEDLKTYLNYKWEL